MWKWCLSMEMMMGRSIVISTTKPMFEDDRAGLGTLH